MPAAFRFGAATEKTTSMPVLRFAPSPNGYLHLGHAYSALFTAFWARRLGGTFLLRLEDIDLARRKPEFVEAIYDDPHWLGQLPEALGTVADDPNVDTYLFLVGGLGHRSPELADLVQGLRETASKPVVTST